MIDLILKVPPTIVPGFRAVLLLALALLLLLLLLLKFSLSFVAGAEPLKVDL